MCVYHGRNQREKNVCGVANQAVCNRRRSWTEASDHSRGCITCPSLGRRLRSDKCVSSQEYVSVRIVLSSRIGKEEDWIECIQNRRPLSFSFHFLEDTRARCIRTVGYEYVGGAPSVAVVVVVVVRHRKTLDSAAHEYAKRIASSRAKVIFFSLSLFFLPFFFLSRCIDPYSAGHRAGDSRHSPRFPFSQYIPSALYLLPFHLWHTVRQG